MSKKKAKEIADFIILGKKPKSAKKKIIVKNKKKTIKNKKHGFKLRLFTKKHKKTKREIIKPVKKQNKHKAHKFFLFDNKSHKQKKKIKKEKPVKKRLKFSIFSGKKNKIVKKAKKNKKKSVKLGFWHRKKKKEEQKIEKKPVPTEDTRQVFTTTGGKTRPIRTEIDDIYDFVLKRKSVRIDVVAKHFKMEEKNVEKLAKILEENNLVMIDYPPFGKLMLEARQ